MDPATALTQTVSEMSWVVWVIVLGILGLGLLWIIGMAQNSKKRDCPKCKKEYRYGSFPHHCPHCRSEFTGDEKGEGEQSDRLTVGPHSL